MHPKKIDDLAFAFVSPLHAENDQIGHGYPLLSMMVTGSVGRGLRRCGADRGLPGRLR